jgi:hypothetical protein
MHKGDLQQWSNYMINLVRRNRVSPKNSEKRVRLNVSVQPATKEKLDIIRGEYSMAALIEAALVDFIFYMENIEKIAEPDGENTWDVLSGNWDVAQMKSRKKRKMKKTVESEGKGRDEGTDEKHNATAETWYDGLWVNFCIHVNPPVQLTIKMNGLQLLCDYNRQDLYTEYCDAIREKRFAVWREGKTKETGKRRKINMEEAKAIFAHFKELAIAGVEITWLVIKMTTEVIDTIVTNCCISLSLNYGVASARMFEECLWIKRTVKEGNFRLMKWAIFTMNLMQNFVEQSLLGVVSEVVHLY